MLHLRLTIDPTRLVEVTDREAVHLRRLGLVADDPTPEPEPEPEPEPDGPRQRAPRKQTPGKPRG